MKQRAANLFILFFIAGFALAGCGSRAPVADTNVGWEKEVKEALACGLDGLKCCLEEDTPCRYGQKCCFNPSDTSDHFCAEDCACGSEGGFCCPEGEACLSGLVCEKRRCVKCGGAGEPCCDNELCQGGGFVCHNGRCRQCGLAGNPCCPAIPFCAGREESGGARNECANGICRLCGVDNTVGCAEGEICDEAHLLNNGFCLACGRFNQPCCDENISGYECQPVEGLACELGFCARRK